MEDGKLNILQLKVYKGKDTEAFDEEDTYSGMIQKHFNNMIKDDDWDGMRLPIFSYPTVLDCLGVKAQQPRFEFLEGYIRVSYDFTVKKADEECLFGEHKN